MKCTIAGCTNTPPEGRKRCDSCRNHVQQLAQRRATKRLRDARCPRDGRPAEPGRQHCEQCLQRMLERQRAALEQRARMGLCADCGQAPRLALVTEDGSRQLWTCASCNNRRRQHDRRRYRQRYQQQEQ